MPVFRSIWQRLYVAVATLSWWVFAACFVVHALVSYVGLSLAGEAKLTDDPIAFLYFYMTTATTVGYGDLSPGTRAGRLIGILVVLPGSIALFTGFLGKAITEMSTFWRRRLQGLGDFSERCGHTLLVGWQGARTKQLIEGLVHEHRGERTVLLATGLAENPLPDLVDFVAAQSIADLDSFARAGASAAATLVVRGADDDETLAATLAAAAVAPQAHIVVHFQDESAAKLIRRQYPDIEVITSIAAGLLARAARDPGASRLAALMFAGNTIDTAFSMKLPGGCAPIAYYDAFCGLKRRHGLTLIGIGDEDGHVDLNCVTDKPLNAGDTLYYIADHRWSADEIDWTGICQAEAAL
jgi:voltage-gated potassium channel